MNKHIETPREFGCLACWPESADVQMVWKQFSELKTYATLINETHFIVSLRKCFHCGQRFVTVFTEIIDWSEGNDPQERLLMPISDTESQLLQTASEDDLEAILTAMAPDRPSLRYRTGRRSEICEGSRGIYVGQHD